MAGEVVIVVEGLRDTAESLGKTQKQVDLAIQRAMNRTADSTRTETSRRIRSFVNLPATYLGPSAGRLRVAERARPGALAIRIEGRDRPTSLARFAGNQKHPKVKVRKGGTARYIPRSFIVNLKNGNRGLAVRTEDGETPQGAWKPKRLGKNLWLLYGPSVDQILRGGLDREGGSSFGDMEDWAADKLEAEFWRLMKVEILSDG